MEDINTGHYLQRSRRAKRQSRNGEDAPHFTSTPRDLAAKLIEELEREEMIIAEA